MSLFGRHERLRARFFDELATSLDAGLPVTKALGLAGGSTALGDAARRAAEHVRNGDSLSEAFESTNALSPMELAVLEAGEQGGQLPTLLQRLRDRHEMHGAHLESLHSKLAYPLLLLHLAVLLPSLVILVQQGLTPYLWTVGPPILTGWAAYFGIRLLLTVLRSAGMAGPIDLGLISIPLVGGVVKERAVADFAATLSLLLQAGVPILSALERSAKTTENGSIQKAHLALAPVLRDGGTLASALQQHPRIYPRLLIESTRVGEESGKLDELLEKTAKGLLDRSASATTRAIAVFGTIVFLAVALYIGSIVIETFSGIYGNLGV
ncbi:MAG: type II secretion system F family protein [Planctomycetota bacterium]